MCDIERSNIRNRNVLSCVIIFRGFFLSDQHRHVWRVIYRILNIGNVDGHNSSFETWKSINVLVKTEDGRASPVKLEWLLLKIYCRVGRPLIRRSVVRFPGGAVYTLNNLRVNYWTQRNHRILYENVFLLTIGSQWSLRMKPWGSCSLKPFQRYQLMNVN